MAVYRALHLARAATPNHGRVLLVTFNNTLVAYLRYLGSDVAGNITIETYGAFARGYLNSRSLMPSSGIVKAEKMESLVIQAMQAARQEGHSSAVLDRELGWMVDEIDWISGMGVADESAYQHMERVGRRTPLRTGGAGRATVWAVRQGYLAARAALGYQYDWSDLATSVRQALAVDEEPRRYRHVIIDEGQDLSPEEIRSLTEAVQPGGSVTFFGDYHQAIYGRGLSWRASGLILGHRPVERFVDNLRNTAEIARVAIAMAESPYMRAENVDLVEPKQPTAAGPQPTVVKCRDWQAEAEYLRSIADDARRDQSVAILARTWNEALAVANGLPYTALQKYMPRWSGAPGLYVGSIHSAKGLEFDTVIVPHLNDDSFPLPAVVKAFGDEEACSREACLLYVAITRAKTGLIMSYSGELTRLLPANNGLWQEEVQ